MKSTSPGAFHSPVFVYDWPKDIKGVFYMYLERRRLKTIRFAVDLLVPRARRSELMSGLARNPLGQADGAHGHALHLQGRGDVLVALNLHASSAAPGFGMGFERLRVTSRALTTSVSFRMRTPNETAVRFLFAH